MQHFLKIVGAMLPIFFLSACSGGFVTNNEQPVLEFKSNAEINSEKVQLSAEVARTADGIICVNIVRPESLNGLQIKHGSAENVITKGGLSYKTDKLVLPNSSEVAAIIEALDYTAENLGEPPFYKDSEEMAFIGKIDAGKFELKASRKSGFITAIKIGEKTTVKFFNQEKI